MNLMDYYYGFFGFVAVMLLLFPLIFLSRSRTSMKDKVIAHIKIGRRRVTYAMRKDGDILIPPKKSIFKEGRDKFLYDYDCAVDEDYPNAPMLPGFMKITVESLDFREGDPRPTPVRIGEDLPEVTTRVMGAAYESWAFEQLVRAWKKETGEGKPNSMLIILIVIVALIAFVGAILGFMAYSGNTAILHTLKVMQGLVPAK